MEPLERVQRILAQPAAQLWGRGVVQRVQRVRSGGEPATVPVDEDEVAPGAPAKLCRELRAHKGAVRGVLAHRDGEAREEGVRHGDGGGSSCRGGGRDVELVLVVQLREKGRLQGCWGCREGEGRCRTGLERRKVSAPRGCGREGQGHVARRSDAHGRVARLPKLRRRAAGIVPHLQPDVRVQESEGVELHLAPAHASLAEVGGVGADVVGRHEVLERVGVVTDVVSDARTQCRAVQDRRTRPGARARARARRGARRSVGAG